jgi:hypothetical protein
MKLSHDDGMTTPDEDARFREVAAMPQVLTAKLGLGDEITGPRGFLHNDPQRILSRSWSECAKSWFP